VAGELVGKKPPGGKNFPKRHRNEKRFWKENGEGKE